MSWVTSAQVSEALGGSVTDPFLDTCTDAANDWAFRRRAQAGYSDDSTRSPGSDVSLGVINYAVVLWRERGAADSYATFDEFSTGVIPSPTMSQILRLLGVPKPQVDRRDSDRDIAYAYRHGYRGIR